MKITHIFLHTTLFIPGIGQLNDNVQSGPKAKFPGLVMEAIPDGVGVKLSLMGKCAVIPWANIKLALYDEKNSQ